MGPPRGARGAARARRRGFRRVRPGRRREGRREGRAGGVQGGDQSRLPSRRRRRVARRHGVGPRRHRTGQAGGRAVGRHARGGEAGARGRREVREGRRGIEQLEPRGSTTEGSVTTPGRRQLCRRRRTDDSPILPGSAETRESIESIVEEVYALEIASKARRRLRAPPRMRTRASATAAERIARNSSLRWRIPARTARRIRRFGPRFPRACTPPRAGRRRRSGIPASRVTSRWTSSATAIASRTITWWRRWRPSSERRERPPPPTPWRRSFNRPDAEGTMRGVQRVPMEVPTVTTTVMTVITVSGARRGPASSERCAARAERLGRRNCWTRWRPSRSCAAGHRAPPRAARCPVTRRQAAAARGPPSSTSASGRMKNRRRRGGGGVGG